MKVFLTTFVIATPVSYFFWSGAPNPMAGALVSGIVVSAVMAMAYQENS